MTKIKAEKTAKGTVQKVGYRDYVQETGRKLNIKGYVKNLRDGSVKIVCETDEDTLKKIHQTPKHKRRPYNRRKNRDYHNPTSNRRIRIL